MSPGTSRRAGQPRSHPGTAAVRLLRVAHEWDANRGEVARLRMIGGASDPEHVQVVRVAQERAESKGEQARGAAVPMPDRRNLSDWCAWRKNQPEAEQVGPRLAVRRVWRGPAPMDRWAVAWRGPAPRGLWRGRVADAARVTEHDAGVSADGEGAAHDARDLGQQVHAEPREGECGQALIAVAGDVEHHRAALTVRS